MPTTGRFLPIGLLLLSLSGGLYSADDQRLPSELSSLDLGSVQPIHRERLAHAIARAQTASNHGEETGKLGMLLHACGQYDLAIACYRQAQRDDSGSFRWPYYQALAAVNREKEEAVDILQETLSLDPSYLPARLKLAETLTDIGRSEESLSLLHDILALHPNAALAHYELGRALEAQNRPREAILHHRTACELFPAFGVAHYALAILYRNQGQIEEARRRLALFEQHRHQRPRLEDPLLDAIHALRFDPKDRLAQGVRLLENDKPVEAIAEFKEALKQDPTLAEAHGNLLSAYMAVGDFAKANEHYLAAVALNANSYETHFNFGLLCSQSGKTDFAAAAFRKALDINPFYAEAHNNLAFILANKGNLDSAIEHFEEAIKNQPSYRDAHFNLGQILLLREKIDEAIPHLVEASVEQDDQTPAILFTVAQAFLRKGEIQKSLDFARQSRQKAIAFSQTALIVEIDKFLIQAQSRQAQTTRH